MNYSPSRTEQVAGEVRAEMARLRVTREVLSESAGIPLSTLRRRLLGQSPFTIDELDAIASVLAVNIVDFLRRSA